jgi:hypothetical protein
VLYCHSDGGFIDLLKNRFGLYLLCGFFWRLPSGFCVLACAVSCLHVLCGAFLAFAWAKRKEQ